MAQEPGMVALVTGASSGIGLEIARCFAEDGHRLAIAADERDKLESAAQELRASGARQVETVPVDLTRPEGAPQLYEAVRDRCGTPDCLVVNAGFGVHGDFTRETDLDAELAMVQLNVVSVVHLVKLFAREMAERGSGSILITSSIAALAPSPKLSVYSATKAFEFAFSEALANELKDTGVTVTALLPSETETDFFARADMEDTKLGRKDKADARTVARAGYDAMMKGSDHVFAPFASRLKAGLTTVLPQRLVTEIARAD